ncbi:MAG TPA: phage minor head protein [Acidobacteriaceae bacterium]|jgi:SPP1 gp7 family putative phage head morphogenesis protein
MLQIPKDHGVQLQVAEQLARTMAAANVLGRLSVVNAIGKRTGKKLPLAMSTRPALKFAEDDSLPDAFVGFDLNLPADDAAAYIRSLTPVTRATFDGLTAQYRKLAFTIAGTADTRLIGKVRDELATVVQRGGTKEDFEKAVAGMTSTQGAQQLNAFTLDTAFQTAVGKAHALGRWEQLSDEDTAAVVPFWKYMTVGDDRVRPEHAVLDGFEARGEDPVWNKIYPPNGFNCRCIVIGLLPEEASDEASEGGTERLPMLARLKVPQQGFEKVF